MSSFESGGRLSIAFGLGLKTSGALLLRTANAGTSGRSGLLVLSTGASSKGNSVALYIGSGLSPDTSKFFQHCMFGKEANSKKVEGSNEDRLQMINFAA